MRLVSISPTGNQYEISSGDQHAAITEVGATLRTFSVGGRDVVRGFGADEVVSGGRGQQLLPWPNRIRDGRYTFNGVEQQLSLSEPDRHNAIHGLVRHVPWVLVEHTTDSVTQQVTVYPRSGWPGTVEATIRHSVSEAGLLVEVTVRNLGDETVPFGYAAHPYFTVGEDTVDDVVLELPAAQYLEVDERLLPVEIRDVDGTEYDLRSATEALGSRGFDTAFTGLTRGEDGLVRVRLSRGERFAELWADESMGWIQIFTGDERRDLSIAVEPMTCGPDAFNDGPTHDDLITIAPGDSYAGRWGVSGG